MKTLVTLLKREYWENRGHFLITPLVIGVIFIFLYSLAILNKANLGSSLISGQDIFVELLMDTNNLSLVKSQEFWKINFDIIHVYFSFIMILVSFIYLLESLYDDRKDRSVLFWKSLPVSDLMTVMSKLITVVFIIPGFFIIAAALSNLIVMLVASIVVLSNGGNVWHLIWEPAPFLQLPIKHYFAYIIQSLWAAPFLAWLLLVSSWATRKPILLATIPLAVVAFIEKYYFSSNTFFEAVRDRVVGWFVPLNITKYIHLASNQEIETYDSFYDKSYLMVTLPEFWYGLIVAGFMVAGAVYIRRYQDETMG